MKYNTLSFLGSFALLFFGVACSTPEQDVDVDVSSTDSEEMTSSCAQGDGKCDVFGEDDRHEMYDFDAESVHAKLARSTGMITLQDSIEVRYDGSVRISPLVPTLGVRRNLCEGQRFEEQPVPGICSGFLVGPDLFMTAGHCLVRKDGTIEKARELCQDDLWVMFDYGYSSKDDDPVSSLEVVPYENAYKCQDVIALRREHACGHDFALLKLDRPVEGREALALRAGGKIEEGTELFSIGHPSGLPKKVALNSFVQPEYSPLADYQPENPIQGFPYNSDEFVGNSGGAVFNAKTGVVEGLSSCGSAGNDYIVNPDNDSCNIAGQCGVNTTCELFGIAYDMPTVIGQLDDEVLTQLDLVVEVAQASE